MKIRMVDLLVIFTAAGLAACGARRGEQTATASVVKVSAERDFYREQAAALASMVTRERKDTEAAYAKGLRDGHAQVNCSPSWPTVSTRRLPNGTFESRIVPVQKPLPPVKPVPPIAAHPKPAPYCKPHKGSGPRQAWECPAR